MHITEQEGPPSVDFYWHDNLLDADVTSVVNDVISRQTEGFFTASRITKQARTRPPLKELVVENERVVVEGWAGEQAILTSNSGIGRAMVHGLSTKAGLIRGKEHSRVEIDGLNVAMLQLDRTGQLTIKGSQLRPW